MPIVSRVGRRSAKVRLVLIGMYLLLSIGGLSMVIPFMITVTGSFANRYDVHRNSVFPWWLINDVELRMKALFEKYDGPLFDLWGSHFCFRKWTSFDDVKYDPHPMQTEDLDPLGGQPPTPAQQQRIKDYESFLVTLDPSEIILGSGRRYKLAYPEFLRDLYTRRIREQEPQAENWSAEEVDTRALDLLNKTHGLRVYTRWDSIPATPNLQPREMRRWFPDTKGEFPDWMRFVESTPVSWRLPVTGKFIWNRYLAGKYATIEKLNAAWGTQYESFYRIDFDWREPPSDVPPEIWHEFLARAFPPRWVAVPATYQPAWRSFIEQRYKTIKLFNDATQKDLKSFDELPTVATPPSNRVLQHTWIDFLDATVPTTEWTLHPPERVFAAFLAKRYDNDVAKLNKAYDCDYASFADVPMPFVLVEAARFQEKEGWWRWHFLVDNYIFVFHYFTNEGARLGRTIWNTTVLVVLSLFTALTVNPLAAYALSRFNLRSTHKILLFLLATMAFPAEVAMIPSFLLLRDMNLLNTYAALVLPGMANGFGIFLLKGFFDSLPIELYEAADLDGASELRKFLQITMPLSAPILAVIALNAFLAAYGGFLWAFTVCQDERMWTLMVWLYQFESKHRFFPWLTMAAIVIASIPTLIVYLFCQRIILRGIILPTMK